MYIQVRIVKIYACKNAIRNSNPVMATRPATGINPKIPSGKTNPPTTFNKVCPAIMLAKSLILRLKGRVKYDITSIAIINGAKNMGTPAGKKNEKNRVPCLKNATIVTKIKITNAMVRVTAI